MVTLEADVLFNTRIPVVPEILSKKGECKVKKTRLTLAMFFMAAVLLGSQGTFPLHTQEKSIQSSKKIKVFVLSGQSDMAKKF